jgi:uncharacterized protein with HEPN domain
MSERRSTDLLLYDILTAVEKIENFTRHTTLSELMDDERTKDAILRNLQVIGDAAKNIPEQFILQHPEIDWGGIAGMRDIITHRYFRVDWQLLWTTIREELPVLHTRIQKIVKEQPS